MAKADKSAAGRSRMYESPDVPDNAYGDGKVAEITIADLRRLKAAGKPFLLACGFIRPLPRFLAHQTMQTVFPTRLTASACLRTSHLHVPRFDPIASPDSSPG